MLQIVSQNECQFVQHQNNFALIRVEDNEQKLIKLNLNPCIELDLIFNDISLNVINNEDIELPSNWIVFNAEMAFNLLNFFEKIDEEDIDLIIHCYAGFSRSSAIGLSYAWYKNDSALEKSILNSHYTPNTTILFEMAKLMDIYEEKSIIINYYQQYK